MGFVREPAMRINVRGPFYDSTCWIRNVNGTTNADLVLKINVQFTQVDSADDLRDLVRHPGDPPLQIQPWGGLWESWKRDAIRLVSRFWNNRLYLVAGGSCGIDWRDSRGRVFRPNFRCGFVIRESSDPHIKIGCVRLVPGAQHMSYFMKGENTLWLDDQDIKPQLKRGGARQKPIVHEFGHILGLSHVNGNSAACQSASINTDICYGPYKSIQSADVMGTGMRLDTWHAWPWRHRLKLHLGRVLQHVETTPVLDRPDPRELQRREYDYRPGPESPTAGVAMPDAGVAGQ